MNTHWISVKDQQPSHDEPIIYARPDTKRGTGRYHVGIAYWTVSQRWNPEQESEHSPEGFTLWMPLPEPPNAELTGQGPERTTVNF